MEVVVREVVEGGGERFLGTPGRRKAITHGFACPLLRG
jgi:hypothetical protein